jgi:hypothetical protein
MPFYTLDDYARDLETLSLSNLLGSLSATATTISCLRAMRKTSGISRTDRITIRSCKEHLPLLVQEFKRRGEEIPGWIEL